MCACGGTRDSKIESVWLEKNSFQRLIWAGWNWRNLNYSRPIMDPSPLPVISSPLKNLIADKTNGKIINFPKSTLHCAFAIIYKCTYWMCCNRFLISCNFSTINHLMTFRPAPIKYDISFIQKHVSKQ